MWWQLVVVAAALAAAYCRWSRRRLHRLAREVPSGLKEYPILGHAYMFLGSNEGMTDAEAIELVSKTCLDKDQFTMKFMRTVFGNGSAYAPVNIWHMRRKIMGPFFNLKNLHRMVPVFQEKSAIMADLMRAEAGGGDFPIWKYMTTYTFDTICETLLGEKMNTQENPDHYLLRAIAEGAQMLAQRIVQPWLHPDCVYERLPVFQRYQDHKQRFCAFTEKIVRSKRSEIRAAEPKRKHDGLINFIESAMQASGGEEKGYSDVELREETMMLIIAGNDTAATSSSFAAVMLSRNPRVQDRVYRELQEVLGDSDREVTPEDFPKLKYLEAVIKESLRLYPPGPVIVREVHNDVVLPSGVTLVNGTGIIFNIWGANRNPQYWGADAEQFRPERFLEGPLRHPAMFLSFSHSLRNCIGATFAMLSSKTVLANLVRRFRLLPPANMAAADLTKPLRVKFEIMMKAVDGFVVRVEERNK